VQLTEECSATILDPLLVKKKDPGCPTITCSIGAQHFSNALCDLGASVSVMPKVVYEKLNHHALAPTAMCLQLADQTVCYLARIAENIPVKIRNFFIPVDFIVLVMEVNTTTPLILGRPFLSTANAHIDVGAREIQLNINGQQEKFAFKPKVEQCNQVQEIRRNKKPEKETKKPLLPNIEALIAFMENLRIQEELRLQEEAKQIKLHNQKNAKCRIQHKKVLASQEVKVETQLAPKKMWRKKVSSPKTPSGDDNRTEGMESPAPDSKPEPSP
jgi:hypothetical protein